MKKLILTRSFAFTAGITAVLPCLSFIIANLLNELNVPLLWKPIAYIFEDPANKTVGLNVSLVVLFGPVIAILINLPQVVTACVVNQKSHTNFFIVIEKYAANWTVILIATICLVSIFIYLLGENCNGFYT